MLCAISVDSTCVRILWLLRQQRGMKMVLAYVTNVPVKMSMSRTRCTLFYSAKSIRINNKVRRLSFFLSLPCLTFSFTFCPFSHQPGCPPYFLLSLPACLSCSLFIYQLSVRFNLVVGSLLSPLDLCNTPTIKISMGIRKVAGLTWNRLLMRVDNSAGKGTSGMNKFGSIIDRMNMKLGIS